jgi:hypothetical protein
MLKGWLLLESMEGSQSLSPLHSRSCQLPLLWLCCFIPLLSSFHLLPSLLLGPLWLWLGPTQIIQANFPISSDNNPGSGEFGHSFLGRGHYSVYHRLPSGPQRCMSIPHAKCIHSILTCPKVSTHSGIISNPISHLSSISSKAPNLTT